MRALSRASQRVHVPPLGGDVDVQLLELVDTCLLLFPARKLCLSLLLS